MSSSVETLRAFQSKGVDFTGTCIGLLWDLNGFLHAARPGCGLDLNQYGDLHKHQKSETPLSEILAEEIKYCSGCVDKMVVGPSRMSVWAEKLIKAEEALVAFNEAPTSLAEWDARAEQLKSLQAELNQFKPIYAWFTVQAQPYTKLSRKVAVKEYYLDELVFRAFMTISKRTLNQLPGGEAANFRRAFEKASQRNGFVLLKRPPLFHLERTGLDRADASVLWDIFSRGNEYLELPQALLPWVKEYFPNNPRTLLSEHISDEALEALKVLRGSKGSTFKDLGQAVRTALAL